MEHLMEDEPIGTVRVTTRPCGCTITETIVYTSEEGVHLVLKVDACKACKESQDKAVREG